MILEGLAQVIVNDQARLEREASQHDLNQNLLKQEGIYLYKDSRGKRERKRKHNNNDDLSVVLATDRPKELQGHNKFDTAPHWETPKRQRQQRKPTDIYVSNMNNVGSPTSTIADSPLAATTTRTNTSNTTNNDSDSESDNDVGEKPLIGSRVAVLWESVIHFGRIISCAMVKGRKHYCIEYDDRSIKEVDSMELSRLQELYIKEINNDAVGQQKQKSQSTPDIEFVGIRVSFMCEDVAFYGTVKRCFVSDQRAKTWYVLYNDGDEEDILHPTMLIRQRHYARHGMYDPSNTTRYTTTTTTILVNYKEG